MAKLNITIVRTLTLALTETEAEWLWGALQNPLHGQHPTEEAESCTTRRHAIFDALSRGRNG